VVVTRDGVSRRVPAGVCWIWPRASPQRPPVVGWTEKGIDYYADLSDEVFHAYLNGCMLQYSSP
jgi:hypothetical protein